MHVMTTRAAERKQWNWKTLSFEVCLHGVPPENFPTDPQKPRLEGLTTLRFFAAILVVFTHWNSETFCNAPEWIQTFILNGYWAVSFFFALSGFVLTYTYLDPRDQSGLKKGAIQFWFARIARVWPIYLLALIVAFPPFIYSAYVSGISHLSLFFGGLVGVPLLLQAWFPIVATAWNPAAWSLSVEAFFYALFPLVARITNRCRPNSLVVISLFLVVGSSLFRHFYFPLPESGATVAYSKATHNFLAFFPLFHLPTFLFGAALSRMYQSANKEVWHLQNLSLVTSLGTVCILFSLRGTLDAVMLTDAVLVPLFGVVILSASACSGFVKRVMSHRLLVSLGEASYAIYILHLPLAFWTTRLWQTLTGTRDSSSMLLFCVYGTLLLIICLVTCECIEKPCRRWFYARLSAARMRIA